MLITILTILNRLLNIFFYMAFLLVWQPRFIGKKKFCVLLLGETAVSAASWIRVWWGPVYAFTTTYYVFYYLDTVWLAVSLLILFWGRPVRWSQGFYGAMSFLLGSSIGWALDSWIFSCYLDQYRQISLWFTENPLANILWSIFSNLIVSGGSLVFLLLMGKFLLPRLHLETNLSPFLVLSEIGGIRLLEYLMRNVASLSIYGYDPENRISLLISVICLLFQCAWALVILFLYRQIRSILRQATQLTTYEQQQRYAEELSRLNQQLEDFQRETARNLKEMGQAIDARDKAALNRCFSDRLADRRIHGPESQTILRTLGNLKVLEFKSLLLSKLNQMQALGIETKLEIPAPVQQIPMDLLDLTRVAGIFLDNALEAARQTHTPQVSLALFYRNGSLLFVVSNSCLPPGQPLEKLMEKGVTTKENGRGMGLYIVSGILENYPNIAWSLECHGEVFRQELEFYPEEPYGR